MTVSVPAFADAVYKPEELMLPKPAVHVTAVLLLPLTLAANWTVLCGCTVAVPGVTLTLTGACGGGGAVVDGLTVTVAEARASMRAALFAVTVTYVMVETDGAVSMPLLDMDPAVVDQSTDVLLVPLTVARNCLAPPDDTLALAGFRLTVMLVGVDGGFTVTVAEALAPVDAALVAVTVRE